MARSRKTSLKTNVAVHGICLCLDSIMSDSLQPHGLCPRGSSVHADSPGKNTRVGCHALLQGIFPTQKSNPGLPYCKRFLYHLSLQGSPRILEWVAYPFSRGIHPGIKPVSPALQTDSLPPEPLGNLPY